MSNRTLIEINHDYAGRLDDEFLKRLGYYLGNGNRETAAELEHYGIRVIGMRHHTGNYVIEGRPDGFPVRSI